MSAALRPSPQHDVVIFDPHPHELHAVVQRRLSAEQKQEVLLLRQHHSGQLGKKIIFTPEHIVSIRNNHQLTVTSTAEQQKHVRAEGLSYLLQVQTSVSCSAVSRRESFPQSSDVVLSYLLPLRTTHTSVTLTLIELNHND